jgi:hypothetical protein
MRKASARTFDSSRCRTRFITRLSSGRRWIRVVFLGCINAVITSALFFGWALAIVLFDCFQRRVPNALVFAGLLLACLLAALGCSPFHASIATALLGVAAGLFALLPFFMIGVMGGADVKVFAALGAWCGVQSLPQLWWLRASRQGFTRCSCCRRDRTARCKEPRAKVTADGLLPAQCSIAGCRSTPFRLVDIVRLRMPHSLPWLRSAYWLYRR